MINVIIGGAKGITTSIANYFGLYVDGDSTLNIDTDALIRNFHTTTTGEAVFIKSGTLNMSSGEIRGNSGVDTEGSAIYGSEGTTINITGGIIEKNTTVGDSPTGAVVSHGTLNIGGNPEIYENYHKETAEGHNLDDRNIYMPEGKYINQVSDFTGLVGIYNFDYEIDGKFGENSDNYSGFENFINNRQELLVGFSQENELIWRDALEVTREVKKGQILVDYNQKDYSDSNWVEINNIVDTSLSETTTVQEVDDIKNILDSVLTIA